MSKYMQVGVVLCRGPHAGEALPEEMMNRAKHAENVQQNVWSEGRTLHWCAGKVPRR
jgi:hypothetical protein